MAGHPVHHGHQHLAAGRAALERAEHGTDVGGADQGLIGQQHHHGLHVVVERAQSLVQRRGRVVLGRGVDHLARGEVRGPLRQVRLNLGGVMAEHQHRRVKPDAAHRAHQPLQQALALHLQQTLGPPAHAPAGASGQDEHAGAQRLWRGGGVHRAVVGEKQVGPDGSLWPSVSAFLACATSMSRGSGTPFFTASTSAMMLTAISGGVLLPM
ncbi:hypothetical protein D9M68_498460 [compost metagenome]